MKLMRVDSLPRWPTLGRSRLPRIGIGRLFSAVVILVLVAALVGEIGDAGAAEKKRGKAKEKEKVVERVEATPIDVSQVWRETEVFSAQQLVKLEPILRASKCTNEKVGCPYLDNGRTGSEASFTFRLIPWNVSSKHRSYLVRNDRCGAGGCDQGLFVQMDGRWRLVVEMFGTLERLSSMTLGFNDLVVQPRGQPPVRVVWDGQTYRGPER